MWDLIFELVAEVFHYLIVLIFCTTGSLILSVFTGFKFKWRLSWLLEVSFVEVFMDRTFLVGALFWGLAFGAWVVLR